MDTRARAKDRVLYQRQKNSVKTRSSCEQFCMDYASPAMLCHIIYIIGLGAWSLAGADQVPLCLLMAFLRTGVVIVVDGSQSLIRDMRVDLRGAKVAVTKQ